MSVKDGNRKEMISQMLRSHGLKNPSTQNSVLEEDDIDYKGHAKRKTSEGISDIADSNYEQEEKEMQEMMALGKLAELDAHSIRKKIEKDRLKRSPEFSPKVNRTVLENQEPDIEETDEKQGKKKLKRISLKDDTIEFVVSDDEASNDLTLVPSSKGSNIRIKPNAELEGLKNDEDFKYIGDVRIDLKGDESDNKKQKAGSKVNRARRRSSVIRRKSIETPNTIELAHGKVQGKETLESSSLEESKVQVTSSFFQQLFCCCIRKKKENPVKTKKSAKKLEKTKNNYANKVKKSKLDAEERNMNYYIDKKYSHLQLDSKYDYNTIPNPAFSSIREVIPHFFKSKKSQTAEQLILEQDVLTLPMKYSSQGLTLSLRKELNKNTTDIPKDSKNKNQSFQSASSLGRSSERSSSDSEIDNFNEAAFRTDYYEQRKGSQAKQERHDFFKQLETMVTKKPFPISFSANKRQILKSMRPGLNEEKITNSISNIFRRKKNKGVALGVDFNAEEGIVTEMFLRDQQEVAKSFKELHISEEHHDYNMLYVCIRANDSKNKAIDKYNWSGNQIMSTGSFTLSQTKKVISGLNLQKRDIWKSGFDGFVYTCRRYSRDFVESSPINGFLMLCVFLNTLMLAMDGLAPDSWIEIFSYMNIAFTTIFTIEMTIKLFGLGIREYCRDTFNIFDGIIVALSLVELVISLMSTGNQGNASSAFKAVRIFRIMRVLRVTRLLRSLRFMKVIIEVLRSTFEQFTYIALLMFLFVFIFTLLGTQIFGGSFTFDVYDYAPVRYNFDSFTSAFFTVFTVLTLENWNEVLYSCLRSEANSVVSVVYLIAWIFIGNYIFINLFLSILLEGFENSDSLQQLDEIDNERRDLARVHRQLVKDKLDRESKQLDELAEAYKEVELITQPDKYQEETEVKNNQACYLVVRNNDNDNESISDDCDIKQRLTTDTKSIHIKADPYKDVSCYKSFFYFKKSHWFRFICARIVSHPK